MQGQMLADSSEGVMLPCAERGELCIEVVEHVGQPVHVPAG